MFRHKPPFEYTIIANVDSKNGMGVSNRCPWVQNSIEYNIEMSKLFHIARPYRVNAVVMGHNTFLMRGGDTIDNCINVVVSNRANWDTDMRLKLLNNYAPDIIICPTFISALKYLEDHLHIIDRIYIIGGASLIATAMTFPLCKQLYIYRTDGNYNCDVFLPRISPTLYEKTKSYIVSDKLSFTRYVHRAV